MKTQLLLAASLLVATAAQAQLTITVDSNGTDLANALVGTGTDITSVQLNCGGQSSGFFSGGGATALGVTSGVVLSTGLASAIPDSASVFASTNMGAPGDPSLEAVIHTATHDRCILEFDVTVAGDTLMMDYVFASEEYPEFQCSAFNDAFAFQLSGPMPGGGTYTNYNIARTPDSDLPVCVNTINSSDSADGVFCTVISSAYYVDNATGTDIVYDGFTVPMTAKAGTIPGQTYHMRFAVADAGDGVWDTGVFLSGGALRSAGATKIENNTTSLASLTPNPTNGITTLKNITSQPIDYAVMNMMGQVLLQGSVQAGAVVTIDLSNLPAGNYMVRTRNSTGVATQRLQVVH